LPFICRNNNSRDSAKSQGAIRYRQGGMAGSCRHPLAWLAGFSFLPGTGNFHLRPPHPFFLFQDLVLYRKIVRNYDTYSWEFWGSEVKIVPRVMDKWAIEVHFS